MKLYAQAPGQLNELKPTESMHERNREGYKPIEPKSMNLSTILGTEEGKY